MKFLDPLLIALLDLLTAHYYRLTFSRYRLDEAKSSNFIVSMTSYPARIKHAWLSIESLFRQEDRNFKLVLVLAENQFPNRRVPRSIGRLRNKGLEILWVSRDGGSFDHLWPVYEKYPESTIISVDDDKFFSPNLVGKLRAASLNFPSTIIGWRGWQMRTCDGELTFGRGWLRATKKTPSEHLFMPPGNGSLYPPGSLPLETGDYVVREKICPNADDVWYWALAHLGGTKSLCLGLPNHRSVWQQNGAPSLASIQPGPKEFQQVIDHFELQESVSKSLTEAAI
jgi:hypothetical protein